MKPLHATWLVSLYNHLTSCEGKRHIAKGWEKASIASVVNAKKCNSLQRIPSRITSLSRPVRQFRRLSGRLLFLYCAHLLNILSCVLSTELYDTHCIDSINSKQLFFCLIHKVLCGAVVSLQTCLEIFIDFLLIVTSALCSGFTKNRET